MIRHIQYNVHFSLDKLHNEAFSCIIRARIHASVDRWLMKVYKYVLLLSLHVGACIADNERHKGKCEICMVYLITYSRADLHKIPTRDVFTDAVKDARATTTGVSLRQWAVAHEMHASIDITTANILHYHMVVRLENVQGG